MKQSHLSDTKFDELSLHPSLLQGLEEAGFEYCTPIQSEALPVALRGEDVAGQAQTGTGKTAAFLLAIFNQLLSGSRDEDQEVERKSPRAIVIAPTRELALQIHHDARLLGKHSGLRMSLAYGGTDYEKQRDDIAAGTDILVGTPGRLIDYLKQGVYNLDSIEVVVLDEADRMFDLGFIKDMRYILRRMPPAEKRLNMLFSATLSHRVMELAYEHMNDPRTITIDADRTVADNIREVVYYPSNAEKIPLLVGLLSSLEAGRTLVFTNTRHAAERIGDWLGANGLQAAVLTGDVPQKKRESLLRAFSEGGCNILVATDVAARGLHIPAVSHVFNFDLPQDAEDYVHRIGRTARAGASGEAVSFACEDYAFHLLDIEEYIGHTIPRAEIDPDVLPELSRPRRSGRQDTRRGGERPQRRGRDGRARPERRDSANTSESKVQESETVTAESPTPSAPVSTTFDASGDWQPPQESAPQDEDSDDEETVAPAERAQWKSSKWSNPNIEIPAIG